MTRNMQFQAYEIVSQDSKESMGILTRQIQALRERPGFDYWELRRLLNARQNLLMADKINNNHLAILLLKKNHINKIGRDMSLKVLSYVLSWN